MLYEVITNIGTIMEQENFFDTVYKRASDDLSSIPWVKLEPNGLIREYLASVPDTDGKKALVIGCGVGDDAAILAEAGYVTDAIDISPTAIGIAAERFASLGT